MWSKNPDVSLKNIPYSARNFKKRSPSTYTEVLNKAKNKFKKEFRSNDWIHSIQVLYSDQEKLAQMYGR